MLKLMPIFGTRPEAIKMAPVILQAQQQPDVFELQVCVTGQHREMLDQMLGIFGITPDIDLDLMQPDQTLADISSRTIAAVAKILETNQPDWVLVQGDTTTVWAAAVAASFQKIPVAHIEAGLRTHDKHQPFPEEINRRLATQIADLHFAPTDWSRQNLINEGIDPASVFVTGNTVIDALHWVLNKNKSQPSQDVIDIQQWHQEHVADKQMVLITGHRRESFGLGFKNICAAIAALAKKYPDICWIYPVHLNPNVQEPVREQLGNQPNIYLLEPQGYSAFAWLMDKSVFILTDSGGVQEEAPSLGKKVLVMRNTTERPEGVEAGVVTLVGNSTESIIEHCTALLETHETVAQVSPYGDGRAAERILRALQETAL